jgi:hypothetical protein
MIEIDHLSYSSISLFQTCSEAWRRKYIAKEPTFSSPELAFGTAFHGTIEQHLNTGQAISELWQEQWQKASTDESRSPIVWGAELPEKFCNDGIRMFSHNAIQAGIERIKEQYQGGTLEREVQLKVPGVPVPVIGFIDVLLAGGIPADFKTSSKAWTQDRAQNEQQSLFYLGALNQAGETVPGWWFKHFVFVKTKTPQFQELEHQHSPSEVVGLFITIQQVWKAIEAGSFVKNPGTWKCSPKYCDFYAACMGK